jgi:hypothetical protein
MAGGGASRLLPTRWGLNLFEGLLVFAVIVALLFAIDHLWPTSGFAQAVHAGAHVISIALLWVAAGLSSLASVINQL